ncbi:CAAX protease family protein [Hokovirus HKV1]|uniref:CAAX protease family protein n=1 Tax=Hokovirus HKV1 TaxID=1977638 RepID=A0A1V0SEU6_9VIRU|nr:CAAX protease family protein [Hokovirus HKV1]
MYNTLQILITYAIFHNVLLILHGLLTKKSSKDEDINSTAILSTIIFTAFMVPIYEEAIFRSLLMTILRDIPNYKLIISIIFGICHIFNISHNTRNGKFRYISTLSQCIMTFLLGQYLNTISLFNALLFHMAFNMIAIFIHLIKFFACSYLFPYKKESHNKHIFISRSTTKKSKSVDNFEYPKNKDCIGIPTKNLPQDIKEILDIYFFKFPLKIKMKKNN